LPTVKMSTAKLPTFKMLTAKLPTVKMLTAKLTAVEMSKSIIVLTFFYLASRNTCSVPLKGGCHDGVKQSRHCDFQVEHRNFAQTWNVS
jgi:hypothetical protein